MCGEVVIDDGPKARQVGMASEEEEVECDTWCQAVRQEDRLQRVPDGLGPQAIGEHDSVCHHGPVDRVLGVRSVREREEGSQCVGGRVRHRDGREGERGGGGGGAASP